MENNLFLMEYMRLGAQICDGRCDD